MLHLAVASSVSEDGQVILALLVGDLQDVGVGQLVVVPLALDDIVFIEEVSDGEHVLVDKERDHDIVEAVA